MESWGWEWMIFHWHKERWKTHLRFLLQHKKTKTSAVILHFLSFLSIPSHAPTWLNLKQDSAHNHDVSPPFIASNNKLIVQELTQISLVLFEQKPPLIYNNSLRINLERKTVVGLCFDLNNKTGENRKQSLTVTESTHIYIKTLQGFQEKLIDICDVKL